MNWLNMAAIVAMAATFQACQSRKKSADHAYAQAIDQVKKEDHSAALRQINRAIAYDPQPQYQALKSTLQYQTRNFKGSKKTLEKLLEDKRLNRALRTQVMNNYAATLNQLGKREEARKIWLELIYDNEYETKEVAWFNLGLISKNPRYASRCFESALTLAPEYIDALFFQTKTYIELGLTKKARLSLKKLLALAPNHPQARALHTLTAPVKRKLSKHT